MSDEPFASMSSVRVRIPVDASEHLGTISGTFWRPAGGPQGVVVIHPATATPERFYAAFAQYLTARDFAAVTYDYRGTGQSGSPKRSAHLRMRDWMSQDVPAVARWAQQAVPGVRAFAIGHSIGGHALALDYGTSGLCGFATVASHVAATRNVPTRSERLRVATVLHLLGPVLTATMGYMPGRRLGLGEDIPVAAMSEWGRWARNPGYFFDDPTMAAPTRAASVRVPALIVGAADDPWATPAQVDALAAYLRGTAVTRRTHHATELGVARLGHHGLLRRGVGEAAWPHLVAWLLSQPGRVQASSSFVGQ